VLAEETNPLIETLEQELAYANRVGRSGIGLAGIQVGLAKQIAIVRTDKVKLNLVNATIKNGYDASVFRDESCLSFPGRSEDTTRYQEVYVVGNLVEPHSFIATGLTAVICQHEIDHYSSKLFFDHKVAKIEPMVKKAFGKVGPNEPCPCGKFDPALGKVKKFKRCCGKA